ncbi:GlxA family transcriptional regulator [Actinacidiphila acididurans]|uniref:Helix-turn-helix domain-containing protein n=1 Tax=Actinacidiphila acididurans TaxID=2784346 RepID=A0ABS2TII2_9ACTN|nr:helix-turn-helix domain-containing protein [Actinacidiphila acididurans]MBM9503144.1 helix-turn-helix domain-containing protein [Actinacidiphila acididurans]
MCENRAMTHRVVVLARPGVLPMELSLVHELFGAAGDRYEVTTCGLAPGPVRVSADFSLFVELGPDALAEADTVVVPGARDPHDNLLTAPLAGPLAAAMAMIRPGARIASVCTGAFVLAAAGLLDGRRATTHWRSVPAFRRAFPDVRLDPDVLYTDEGDVLTSAGGAAGIDLCLHLIRRDHGTAVAVEVARTHVVPPHRDGGQAQFIELPVAISDESSTSALRSWLLGHLDHPVDLDELARRSTMSKRTLTRRFREETGLSPIEWLNHQRLSQARWLLESTDLPVDQVAERAGFGTGGSLRLRLRDTLGVSPTTYRATFRGPRPTQGPESKLMARQPQAR